MDKRWSHCTFPHAWLAGCISKSTIMSATARSCGFDHKWLQVWAVVVKVKGGVWGGSGEGGRCGPIFSNRLSLLQNAMQNAAFHLCCSSRLSIQCLSLQFYSSQSSVVAICVVVPIYFFLCFFSLKTESKLNGTHACLQCEACRNLNFATDICCFHKVTNC